METMSDIKDILDLDRPSTVDISKEAILGPEKKSLPYRKNLPGGSTGHKVSRRPEGMAREVFALLYNDKKDVPPLFPTDTGQGYKNTKANLSMKSVRPWKWMPFTNPARTDNAVFHHWRRVCDEGKEYPFARFNKKVQIPDYSDHEYSTYLTSDSWTRAETDHLFDLCRRFDLRFVVMADRWDQPKFRKRSIEDLKERYYAVCSALAKIKTGPGLTPEMKNYVFDAEHERKRKEQLARLYSRTKEQVEEEQMLQNELRKIEARKKERDKKTQDLQKLITAADCQTSAEIRRPGRAPKRRLAPTSRPRVDNLSGEISGIKFPDLRGTAIYLRSQRMKLPANLGQKKVKAIEQLLSELNIEPNPTPTEEICKHFNDLRNDLLLLHELRVAMSSCEFELQTLRHQYEASNPGKTLIIPPILCPPAEPSKPAPVESQNNVQNKEQNTASNHVNQVNNANATNSNKMEIIDVVGSSPQHS